jgi:4-amino-4-deoxy-L-arabinose transferase-like glycosyltransferase
VRHWAGIGVLIAGVFICLATAVAVTRIPWWDEATLVDPAHNLAVHGRFASTVLIPTGHPIIPNLVGYDSYTYWTMPLYFVSLATWFKMVGYSLFAARLFSVLWGVALIASLGVIATELSGQRGAGAMAAAIAATDYTLIMSSTHARMDSMGAALGYAGLACYLVLRRGHFEIAVVAGAIGAAAAVLTHPVGLLHSGGLVLAILMLDRSRLRFRTGLLVILPYLVGMGLWGLYIAKAPAVFLQQIRATTEYRIGGVFAPLQAIASDFYGRYVFYFSARAQSGPAKLKLLTLFVYSLPFGLCLLKRSLRQSPGVQLCLLCSIVYYCGLAILDHSHTSLYVVYVVPLPILLLTFALIRLCTERKAACVPALVGLGVFMAFQVGGVAMQVWKNPYATEYGPVVRFVRTTIPRGATLVAPAELWFALGADYHIIDDSRLAPAEGTKPQLIITGQFYPDAATFRRRGEREVADRIERVLTRDYHLTQTVGFYRIYVPAVSSGQLVR